MYPETAYALNDARRCFESLAVVLDAQGKPYFASEARQKAKTLSVLLSGAVACCEYRAAADQVKQVIDAAGALSQALPPVPQMENAPPSQDMNAAANLGQFDFGEDQDE